MPQAVSAKRRGQSPRRSWLKRCGEVRKWAQLEHMTLRGCCAVGGEVWKRGAHWRIVEGFVMETLVELVPVLTAKRI